MFLAAVLLAAAAQPCANANTQTDLNQCWGAQSDQADAQLDKTLAKVKAGLHALGVDPAPLTASQQAWESARDATCGFETSLYEGGSIQPMMGSQCDARMTQARTKHLDAYLAVMQAQKWQAAAPVSAAADAKLNRFYKLYLAQLTAEQKKSLTDAELAWLKYRDKACAVEGGTCLTDLERERVDELQAGWLGEPFW